LTDQVVPVVASLVLALVFLHAHASRIMRPNAPIAGNNWFGCYDQGRYLEAALAWQRGDLTVAHHLYMPGYPLLAVPFLHHLPALGLPLADPFLPADLAALIASLWLVMGIAIRLMPGMRHAGALGALTFLATMLASPPALDVWVVPWSTSPATPLILLCLWAALSFHAEPGRIRWALLTGFAGAAIAAFRPTDMVVTLLPAILLIAWTLFAQRASWQDWGRALLAGLFGVVAAFGIIALFYVPIYGFSPSPYMIGASRTGFEWRLLPLRWVILMLDPRPLLPEGRGLLSAFPWILSGLGGAVALTLLPSRAGRAPHALVLAATAGYTALYLCYRDLHSGGLWLYFNYHYFKWVLPVTSLLTVLWVVALVTERHYRWPRLTVGAGVIVVLLPWQAELRPVQDPAAAPYWNTEGQLLIPKGLPDLSDGVVFAARGSWDDMFMGRSQLASPAGDYAFNSD
jgi:hypothetical protein